MALYEFRCAGCGYVIARRFPISERPEFLECPKCGEEMKRVITSPHVIYRGNGWGRDYKTNDG